jgi:hypothetical protein
VENNLQKNKGNPFPFPLFIFTFHSFGPSPFLLLVKNGGRVPLRLRFKLGLFKIESDNFNLLDFPLLQLQLARGTFRKLGLRLHFCFDSRALHFDSVKGESFGSRFILMQVFKFV